MITIEDGIPVDWDARFSEIFAAMKKEMAELLKGFRGPDEDANLMEGFAAMEPRVAGLERVHPEKHP